MERIIEKRWRAASQGREAEDSFNYRVNETITAWNAGKGQPTKLRERGKSSSSA